MCTTNCSGCGQENTTLTRTCTKCNIQFCTDCDQGEDKACPNCIATKIDLKNATPYRRQQLTGSWQPGYGRPTSTQHLSH